MHESYSGDPDCEKKRKEDGESRSQTTYDDGFGWDGGYGGDTGSCGFSDMSRYFSSIRTIDESLKTIFDSLRESGKLNNTIIMGAGDHAKCPVFLSEWMMSMLQFYPSPFGCTCLRICYQTEHICARGKMPDARQTTHICGSMSIVACLSSTWYLHCGTWLGLMMCIRRRKLKSVASVSRY